MHIISVMLMFHSERNIIIKIIINIIIIKIYIISKAIICTKTFSERKLLKYLSFLNLNFHLPLIKLQVISQQILQK